MFAIILAFKEWKTKLINVNNFFIMTNYKALKYFGTKRLFNK